MLLKHDNSASLLWFWSESKILSWHSKETSDLTWIWLFWSSQLWVGWLSSEMLRNYLVTCETLFRALVHLYLKQSLIKNRHLMHQQFWEFVPRTRFSLEREVKSKDYLWWQFSSVQITFVAQCWYTLCRWAVGLGDFLSQTKLHVYQYCINRWFFEMNGN